MEVGAPVSLVGSTLKPVRNQTMLPVRLWSQAPPPQLNGKLCQWSTSCSLVLICATQLTGR